jgi:hypothetical protein
VGLFDDAAVDAEIVGDVSVPDPRDLTGARPLI